MSIFTQNLTLEQGADFSFTSLPYTLGGVVQTLVGASCRMMLRLLPADVSAALSLTSTPTASGSVTPNGAAGTVTIAVTKVATASLSPGAIYQYDLFVDLAGGTSVRLLSGTMTLVPSVTH